MSKRYYVDRNDDSICEYYQILKGPDGFECMLTEPEDRSFTRDLAPVVSELNRADARIQELETEVAESTVSLMDVTERLRSEQRLRGEAEAQVATLREALGLAETRADNFVQAYAKERNGVGGVEDGSPEVGFRFIRDTARQAIKNTEPEWELAQGGAIGCQACGSNKVMWQIDDHSQRMCGDCCAEWVEE